MNKLGYDYVNDRVEVGESMMDDGFDIAPYQAHMKRFIHASGIHTETETPIWFPWLISFSPNISFTG